MKTRISLKYFVSDFLWKQFFAPNSTKTHSNLISLTILVTLMPFVQFQPKIRAIKLQKCAKICLTWLLLFRDFHWGRNLVLKDFKFVLGRFFRKIKYELKYEQKQKKNLQRIIFLIFWDFLCFTKFSFHHKWNDARLLFMKIVFTTYYINCRTT